MKRSALALILGLAMTVGSVFALDENAPGTSDRVIKKLLALTDSLQERVTVLEKTVDKQTAEIARLKLQQSLTPGQAAPRFHFTPETPSPNQPQIWQYPVIPVSPATPPGLPPGSVPREINGMRFYIVPCTPDAYSAPAATPPSTAVLPDTSRVPIRITVPATR
jgi:hypothetical protein